MLVCEIKKVLFDDGQDFVLAHYQHLIAGAEIYLCARIFALKHDIAFFDDHLFVFGAGTGS